MLWRLAQIANELDESGLPQEASMLDSAIGRLSPPEPVPVAEPEQAVTPPISDEEEEIDTSVMGDEISTLVDSVLSDLRDKGLPFEALLTPEGEQAVAAHLMSTLQAAAPFAQQQG